MSLQERGIWRFLKDGAHNADCKWRSVSGGALPRALRSAAESEPNALMNGRKPAAAGDLRELFNATKKYLSTAIDHIPAGITLQGLD